MRKTGKAAFILLLACLFSMAGCGILFEGPEPSSQPPVHQSTPKPVARTTPKPQPVPTPKPQPKNRNLLTGVADLSESAIGKRPVAVMVDNSYDALPQYGVSEADLLFELPVEYGVTRLMALYGDYTRVPQVCAVRSCRYYYPILAAGYDAYYVHWGEDATIAAETLRLLDIDNLDGMHETYGLFRRDEARARKGFAYEHTGVFDGPALEEALKINKVRTDLPVNKNDPFFDFNSTARKPEGESCTWLEASFSGAYTSTFTYNEKSHLYYKEHSGRDHRDQLTGKQLAFTNIFLLETDVSVRDGEGRLDVGWKGGKDSVGYYVSEGAVCRITWEKADEYSNLIFYAEDGARLRVNPGKSYLGLLSPNSVSFGAETGE